MGRRPSAVGAWVVLVGVLIALGPFFSLWRVGGEMLDALPELDGVDHSDERVWWSAVFDDELVLARRTFHNVDEPTVTGALAASGFESSGVVGYSKDCCGDYDAVWADVQSLGPGRVVVELTAADSDWQLAWPLFSGFGSLVALVGIGILLRGGSAAAREHEAVHAAL